MIHFTRPVIVSLTTVTALWLVVALTSCRQTKNKYQGKGRLASVSVVRRIPGSEVIGKILNPEDPNKARAAFFFKVGNSEEEINFQYEFKFAKNQEKGFFALWKGYPIGEAHADGSGLTICSGSYELVCDVTYIQDWPPHKNHLMLLGLLPSFYNEKYGTPSVDLNPTSSYALDQYTDRIDISGPATTEINQGNTGTCLYNSTAGIIEWYLNLQSGRNDRLSAIDLLSRLDNDGQAGESGAINRTASLGGIVPDEVLPTQQTYNQYPDFYSVYNYSEAVVPGLRANRTRIPRIGGTVLFMRSQPAKGSPGPPGVSSEEMQKVRQWLFENKRPVHLFAYYSSIWHAIIALGWDDTNGMILIKDSLKESGQKAQWKSISVYQPIIYGAVGTRELDPIAGNYGNRNYGYGNNSGGNYGYSNNIGRNFGYGNNAGGNYGYGNNPGGNYGYGNNAGSNYGYGNYGYGNNAGGNYANGTFNPRSNGPLATVLGREEGLLRLYLYSQRPATSMAILGSDNRWYSSDRFYPKQPGWETIGSILVSEGWKNRNSVRVKVRFQDGTEANLDLPLDDKRF